MKNTLLVFIVLLSVSLLAVNVSGLPTTNAATAIGSNNATISASGVTGTDCWFIWGQNSGNEYWTTVNLTASGGAITYTLSQSPLFGNQVFYFKACDLTGCGNERSFTTLPVTPIVTPRIGVMYRNITENGYNMIYIAQNLYEPFVWSGSPLTIVFMLIFSPIFIGVWAKSKTVIVALILGFITGSFILYANAGLNLGMPPEIVIIAQSFCYIAFAGVVLYVVKR